MFQYVCPSNEYNKKVYSSVQEVYMNRTHALLTQKMRTLMQVEQLWCSFKIEQSISSRHYVPLDGSIFILI